MLFKGALGVGLPQDAVQRSPWDPRGKPLLCLSVGLFPFSGQPTFPRVHFFLSFRLSGKYFRVHTPGFQSLFPVTAPNKLLCPPSSDLSQTEHYPLALGK